MELKKRRPLIICICGKAGNGKGFISEIICDECKKIGLDVVVSPYTKYLKKYISEITGWDMNDKDKPRDLLQKISSDLIKGKLKDKDFFIRRQLEDINVYFYFFDIIIIPDVRFPDEIEILKSKYPDVISIGVVRKNFDNGLNMEQKNDITEIALDDYDNYDYYIENDGTDSFCDSVINIFREMRNNNE